MQGYELYIKEEHEPNGRYSHLCGGMTQLIYLAIEFSVERSISVQWICLPDLYLEV